MPRKILNENNATEAPHQITQSQQVRRISARRERISAVSAWAQWGAPPLQPSKTTRNFGRANERRTGCVGRLAEGTGFELPVRMPFQAHASTSKWRWDPAPRNQNFRSIHRPPASGRPFCVGGGFRHDRHGGSGAGDISPAARQEAIAWPSRGMKPPTHPRPGGTPDARQDRTRHQRARRRLRLALRRRDRAARRKGHAVTVVCLSFGERGESAKLWKEPGMTLERVKAVRRVEAEHAAAAWASTT